MATRQLLTASQAAEHLNTSWQRLFQWRRAGVGPEFILMKGRYYYYADGLETWLADNTVRPMHPHSPAAVLRTPEDRPLTDAEWLKVAPLMSSIQRNGARLFIDGILHLLWTARPWHLLPATYGAQGAVRKRFHEWRKLGLWESIFAALSDDPAFPYKYVKRESLCAVRDNYNGQNIASYFMDVQTNTIGPVQIALRSTRRESRRSWDTIAEREERIRQRGAP